MISSWCMLFVCFLSHAPVSLKTDHWGLKMKTIHPRETLVTKWRRHYFTHDNFVARHCLDKWFLNIKCLSKLVSPKVLFANILLAHHGWPTAHRTGAGKMSRCPLCGKAMDFIAHTINCSPVRKVFDSFFNSNSVDIHKRKVLICTDLHKDDLSFLLFFIVFPWLFLFSLVFS